MRANRRLLRISPTVIFLPLALLAGVGCSNPEKPSSKEACILNLKAIDAAREKWVSEHSERAGQPIESKEVNEIIRYLKDGRMPHCPANGAYWINKTGKPICSVGDSQGHQLQGQPE